MGGGGAGSSNRMCGSCARKQFAYCSRCRETTRESSMTAFGAVYNRVFIHCPGPQRPLDVSGSAVATESVDWLSPPSETA